MAYLESYAAVGNREDLSDIIKNISPTETPIYSMAGDVKASNRTHEWLEEELRDPAANAKVEGADFSVVAGDEPTLKNNYTQIFTQAYGVSATEQAIEKAGIKNVIARRMRNAMKECALDVEYALVNNASKVVGDASTARQLGGIQALVTTNVADNSATPRALTETLFNASIQDAWAAGGNPNKVMVSGTNKRNVSSFTASSTKNVDANSKKLVAAVDVYESDFGLVTIVAHRQMPNTDIYFLDSEMIDIATLRPFKQKNLSPDGDRVEKAVVGEKTLVVRAEKSCAILTDLNGAVA